MSLFENVLGVKHDGVDSRHLLKDHQHEANGQRLVDAWVRQVRQLKTGALVGRRQQRQWSTTAASSPSLRLLAEHSPVHHRRLRCGHTRTRWARRVLAGSAGPPRPLASCHWTAGSVASPAWSTCRPWAAWAGWSSRSPASASPGKVLRGTLQTLFSVNFDLAILSVTS